MWRGKKTGDRARGTGKGGQIPRETDSQSWERWGAGRGSVEAFIASAGQFPARGSGQCFFLNYDCELRCSTGGFREPLPRREQTGIGCSENTMPLSWTPLAHRGALGRPRHQLWGCVRLRWASGRLGPQPESSSGLGPFPFCTSICRSVNRDILL